MEKTIGMRLGELVARAGLSNSEFSRLAGYKTPSGVQAILNPDYNPPALNMSIVRRIMPALEGRGDPPIMAGEILWLATLDAPPELISIPDPTPTLRGLPKDVPVYGTALAADLEFDGDGNGPEEIEQTVFEMGEIITYVRRPPALVDRQKVYALFVAGSSMEPRYRPGDPIFVDPLRPPAIGDDVVVQILGASGDEPTITAGLIKTLVRRTSAYLELEQYRPEIRFRVPSERIAHIHRVIPWREAFGM